MAMSSVKSTRQDFELRFPTARAGLSQGFPRSSGSSRLHGRRGRSFRLAYRFQREAGKAQGLVFPMLVLVAVAALPRKAAGIPKADRFCGGN